MIQVGQTVGNYQITAKLGEGGMGVVYLAEHPVIGRKVAIKAIHPELSRNHEVVSRFMTEAQSVNKIGNEHIVEITDYGNTPEGEFYFMMEFLQGEALADRLRREHVFDTTRAVHIGGQVADALAASHDHGIIHRDLKPENIFLVNRASTNDFVKVLDFGLAKLTQGDEKVSHKTRTGSVMGTPYYMAPEQCEGRPNIDHRADVYSLGVILFEMMTGKVPFGGEGYGEIIVKHITMPPPSPRAINPMISEAFEAILMRALAKKREERFQTMGELRAALDAPEAYLSSAPAVDGVAPSAMADPTGSTRMTMTTAVRGAEAGAKSQPMPSTFRENAGEMLETAVMPQKSRKGLVIGAVVAAVAAAGAAVVFVGKGGDSQATGTANPAVVDPKPAEPAKPAVPATVKIRFESKPEGAEVVRKDNGQSVGTTPFDLELPFGQKSIEFVFKKADFEDATLAIEPDSAKEVVAPLLPARKAEPVAAEKTEPKAEKAESKGSSKAKPKVRDRAAEKAGVAPASTGGKRPTKVDDDGVLEPSFK